MRVTDLRSSRRSLRESRTYRAKNHVKKQTALHGIDISKISPVFEGFPGDYLILPGHPQLEARERPIQASAEGLDIMKYEEMEEEIPKPPPKPRRSRPSSATAKRSTSAIMSRRQRPSSAKARITHKEPHPNTIRKKYSSRGSSYLDSESMAETIQKLKRQLKDQTETITQLTTKLRKATGDLSKQRRINEELLGRKASLGTAGSALLHEFTPGRTENQILKRRIMFLENSIKKLEQESIVLRESQKAVRIANLEQEAMFACEKADRYEKRLEVVEETLRHCLKKLTKYEKHSKMHIYSNSPHRFQKIVHSTNASDIPPPPPAMSSSPMPV
ncbi:hypothetical protein ADUPG1_010149, partial [Aduncisulcus paluster]